MLELCNVSKRYGGVVALEPTTLQLSSGRTYVLLGTSGCGKSTLLKIALGLTEPDSGTVRFEGQTLQPDNVLQIRKRIGYVIQSGGLFPHLTARKNVSLIADFLNWSTTKIRNRIEELSALTQLPESTLDRYPAQLSGGQQQRVALMRALMLDPDWMLLDEPLGALDPMIRSDLQNDLSGIFRSLQKSVVLVTHDLHEAAHFGDEIILLREGRLVQAGTMQELIDHPSDPFVTRFIQAQHGISPSDRLSSNFDRLEFTRPDDSRLDDSRPERGERGVQ
ncbi:MAG: ATP-binding cassette domain-containing protein [Rubripirellula sp.]